MAGDAVLLLGNDWASLCLARRGKVHAVHPLPPAAQAVDRLRALAGGREVRVLLDVVEEEYVVSVVPPAGRRDRKLMIERRLAVAFETTPWRLGLALRPQAGDPSGRRVLLCGLTAPGRIRPWLSALRAAGSPLVGLYSLPLISAALLPTCGLQQGAAALLSQHPGSGLRMSFLVDGQLLASRLLPVYPAADTAFVWQDALGRLRPWLEQAGCLRPDTTLAIGLLGNAGLLETLRAALPQVPNSRVHELDVSALARCYGCASGAPSSPEDALFAACLLQRLPAEQYATAADRADWRARRRRRLGRDLLAACCVAMSLCSLALTRLGLRAAQDAAALAAENQSLAASLKVQQQALPPRFIEPAAGLALREFCRDLAAAAHPSLPALDELAAPLAAAPALRWTQIEWPAQGQTTGLLLHGEVHPFDGDYGAALAAIEQLLEGLRQRPAIRAAVLHQSPLPTPGAAAQVIRSDGASARFTLGLALRGAGDASGH